MPPKKNPRSRKNENGNEATLTDVVQILANMLKVLTGHGAELKGLHSEMGGLRTEMSASNQRLDGVTTRLDILTQATIRSRTEDVERFGSQEARIRRLEEHVFPGGG